MIDGMVNSCGEVSICRRAKNLTFRHADPRLSLRSPVGATCELESYFSESTSAGSARHRRSRRRRARWCGVDRVSTSRPVPERTNIPAPRHQKFTVTEVLSAPSGDGLIPAQRGYSAGERHRVRRTIAPAPPEHIAARESGRRFDSRLVSREVIGRSPQHHAAVFWRRRFSWVSRDRQAVDLPFHSKLVVKDHRRAVGRS